MDDIVSKFSSLTLLVVGDVMLDEHIWGSARRISQEAPVLVVDARDKSFVPGGAGNTAANAAGLGAKVLLAGVVGGDEPGKRLCAALTARGIDIAGLLIDSSRPTTTKTRVLAQNQQMLRIDQEQHSPLSAAVEESLCRFIEQRLPEVDACILSDYAKGVVSPALAGRLIHKARSLGKPLVVDPKGMDFGKYRGASVVKPNLNEAALFLRHEINSPQDILEAGRRLLDVLGSSVLLTRGAAGMSLFQNGSDVVHIPAVAREVFDVTGAGDTVAATLALSLAAGASLEESAQIASRAAAVIVGRVGTAVIRAQDLLDAREEMPAPDVCRGDIAPSANRSPGTNATGKGEVLTTKHNRLARCRHGLMLYNRHDTHVGLCLDRYGEFSEQEVTLFRQALTPGSVVVEAGANVGALTVPLARLVGPQGAVFAFEPQRLAFQLLCANSALNDLTNVFCRHAALGKTTGTLRVPLLDPGAANNVGGLSLENSSRGEEVPVETIDDLRLRACRLIKVDVEGMERDVLLGATETIRRHRPLLYVENDRAEKSADLIEHIHGLGYRLFWHLPLLFNRANFSGESENLFSGIVSANMLGIPDEANVVIKGLKPVLGPNSDWRSPLPRGASR